MNSSHYFGHSAVPAALHMKTHVESSPIFGRTWLFRGNSFHSTLLLAFIAVTLLGAPTVINAQNPHKPTSKVMKPLRNERLEQSAPVGQSSVNTGAILDTSTSLVPVGPAWTVLGPMPIPNGQTVGTEVPVSGRVTAVAIDPGDSETVYVGTAQGGLYQSRNGGATWTPLMDSAGTLAIGSLEIDPMDSNTLLVGSGESNFSGDS